MTDATDIHAEIERKAIETLVEWLERMNKGLCSRSEAKAALRALWSAVAGLVSKPTMEEISEAIDAIGKEVDEPRRKIYRRGYDIRIMDMSVDDVSELALYKLKICEEPKKIPFVEKGSNFSQREIADKVQKLDKAIRDQGFRWI